MALPSWLLPLALLGLGGLGVLACFGVANNLAAIAAVLDKRMAEFGTAMKALQEAIHAAARGLQEFNARTPLTTLGHMHLKAPAVDPERFNYDDYKYLRGGGWIWAITDRTGAVLREEAALPIKYEEVSVEWVEAHPELYEREEVLDVPFPPAYGVAAEATDRKREAALFSEAERAARTAFPVSSVRKTPCGYDIVL